MRKLYTIVLLGKSEKVWLLNTLAYPEDLPTYVEEEIPITRYPFTTKWEEFRYRFFPPGVKYCLELEGKTARWNFAVNMTKKAHKELDEDGIWLDKVENIIPQWVARHRLVRPWCFFQDLFNFNFKSLWIDKDKLL